MTTETTFGKNTLIALAYLKSSDSPVKSISQLMYYCMTQVAHNIFDYDKVSQSIKDICSLELPVGIIKICLKELCDTKYLQYDKKEKTYTLLNNKNFDISRFEAKLSDFSGAEENVSNGFLSYLKEVFDIDWTQDIARLAIKEFLSCGENAVSIFIGDEIVQADVGRPWYFASYLESVQADDIIMKYVKDLAYGYAKCIGLLGSSDKDGNININQGFAGTEFYFDTKLILRYLGYSYDSEVKAVKELVAYIKNARGFTCLFSKNLDEIGNALHNAALSVKKGHSIIEDDEMGFFISDSEKADNLVDMFVNSPQRELLQARLEKKGFRVVEESDTRWNNKYVNANNIDVKRLEKYIANAHEQWKPQAIENDVDAINRINRLRSGNYEIYFGGKRKLPVFVTSNYFLVRDIARYAKDQNGEVNWGRMCLPLISDTLLAYSIWIKGERNGQYIENAILSKMIFALNHSCSNFRAKLIEETKRLQETSPEDMPFILETAHINTIHDVIKVAVSATQGNVANLSNKIIIFSEKEAIQNHTYQLKIENEGLSSENSLLRAEQQMFQSKLEKTVEENKKKEIRNFVESYEFKIKRLLPYEIILKSIRFSIWGIAIILSITSAVVGYIFKEPCRGIIVGALLAIGLFLIDIFKSRYKEWIKRLFIKSFTKKLEKHINVTQEKICNKTEFCDEILVQIRKTAYNKYGLAEEYAND